MNDEYTKDSVQVARLEERVANIAQDLHEHRTATSLRFDSVIGKLDEIIQQRHEIRGGWKALTVVGTVGAALVEAAHKIVEHLSIK
jgi:ornithine cyclodeaminase/alanine dehydrogenase-like protein (mu-crystallin family)